jgi:uncharacterized protein
MNRARFFAFSFLLLLCFAVNGLAQGKAKNPGPAARVSPSKDKEIRRLLKLTESSKVGQQVMSQMFAMFKRSATEVPDSVWEELNKEFSDDLSSGAFLDRVVPVYSAHFSEQDIKGLIAFYESPLGKKTISKMPQVVSEMMMVGQQWGEDMLKKLRERLKKKGYNISAL